MLFKTPRINHRFPVYLPSWLGNLASVLWRHRRFFMKGHKMQKRKLQRITQIEFFQLTKWLDSHRDSFEGLSMPGAVEKLVEMTGKEVSTSTMSDAYKAAGIKARTRTVNVNTANVSRTLAGILRRIASDTGYDNTQDMETLARIVGGLPLSESVEV